MTTLGSHMIRNDWRALLATIDVDGIPGQLVLRTRNNWNQDVDVFLKMKGHKAVRVTKLSDCCPCDNVRSIVREHIHEEFVIAWHAPFNGKPAFETCQEAEPLNTYA